MFTDVHASHLRGQLDNAEDIVRGWQALVDYAVSRCPRVVVDTLKATLGESEQVAEGWRTLHNYADAHKAHSSLPGSFTESIAQYSTGGRLEPPARPCACGLPGVPGVAHSPEGCQAPEAPSPAGQVPPIPQVEGRVLSSTQVLPPGWTPGQEGAFQAFEEAHREHAAEQGVTLGRADGEPVGRDPYARDGGS
ncbi:hypothetical protein Skr01_36650 [Sphaerisporangium krabiense]|nr:hypothetical protein Skr01_36650 [Sphaerisporangium krabiense]